MGKQTLLAALAVMTAKVYGSSKCLDEKDVSLEDISTVEYPMSWGITLNAGKGCWYDSYNTALATWESGSEVSVAYQIYKHPFGNSEEDCQP